MAARSGRLATPVCPVIDSIPAQAKRFTNAVRGHRGVEKRAALAPRRAIFREDASRIRKGKAPAILTAIRHLALNPFEQEPSKLRLSRKRRLRRLEL